MRGIRAISAAAALWIGLQTPACATDLVRRDGRLVHAELGFSIDDPSAAGSSSGVATAPGSRWEREPVEGAEVSYRAPGGERMSLVHKCGPLPDDLRLLARELLIGLDDRELLEEGPVSVDGAPGWAQTARARLEGRGVELRTVTRRLGSCSLDWVLVGPGSLAPVRDDFERWWASFRTADDTAGEEGTPDTADTPSAAGPPDTAGAPSAAGPPDTAGAPSAAGPSDGAGALARDGAGDPAGATAGDGAAGTPSAESGP